MSAGSRAGGGAFIVSGLLASLALTGCGDDGFGERYPVYGTVTYQDEPVERGRITFVPDQPDGRPASGEIRDGEYELTTIDPGDGALPGTYKVTVKAVEVDDSQVLANAEGGVGNQADVIRATQSAIPLVPAKYQLPETSGLTAEVEEGSNELDFEL